MRVPDFVTGLILIVGGIVLVGASYSFSTMTGLSVGPGTAPFILGVAFAGAGALLIIGQRRKGAADAEAPVSPAATPSRGQLLYPAVILGALLIYLVTLDIVGFLPLTFAFVILAVWAGGGRVRWAVPFSLIVTAGVDVLLVNVMQVPLPQGMLG